MKGAPYEQLWIHRFMLKDIVRGETYQNAIDAVVTPDSVVLDMGAGSGILSFMAARAGARKVYAVERTSIARVTLELARLNGLQDRIQVIQDDVRNIVLPEKVDVLLSEWLGPIGVDENLLHPLLTARDRWLKPEGKILPENVTAWMAPIYDPILDSEMFFWTSRPYGFDLTPIARHSVNEIRYGQQHIQPEHLLAEFKLMWTTDIVSYPAEDAIHPFRTSLSFICKSEGTFNSLGLWFDAQFPNGGKLICGPGAPRNHWGTTVCPLDRIVQVNPGTEIKVDFACELDDEPGRTFSNWSVCIDGHQEKHNTRDSIT